MAFTDDSIIFKNILLSDHQVTNSLIDLMQKEKELILKQDRVGLQQILLEKVHLLEQLEQNRQQRIELLSQYQLKENRLGMETFITQHTQGNLQQELQHLWQSLVENLKKCQEANRTNGLVISANLKAIERLQTVLFESSGDQSVTYNTKGQKAVKYNRRPLDRA